MKAKDALGAEWEARMTDAVARHAQQMAVAAASYEARLADGRRELAAVQVPASVTISFSFARKHDRARYAGGEIDLG